MKARHWLLKREVRRGFRSALVGRERVPGSARHGRFTRPDVDGIVDDAWAEVETLLPAARLQRFPRRGTRLNVFLAVVTLAAFRALRRAGVDHERAISLTADGGWPVYQRMLRLPRALARLFRRAPQSRMSFIIRSLLRFPFAPPADHEAPGYRVRAWEDDEGMHTHWTRCPPLDVFRALCQGSELDAFRGTWCQFDFPAAEQMVRGGRFRRPHVLSEGDPVCDMTWTVSGPSSGTR